MGKRRIYTGTDIEIGFEVDRCIHARNCFLKLPAVFDPSRRAWVDPDAAPAEEIAAMVRTCPSGALTFRRLDGGRDEAAPAINRIAVLENGPLALAGDLVVDGEAMTRATLCRCGASANKPFCDYAHVEACFAATGEPPAKEGEAGTDERGGTLEDHAARERAPAGEGRGRDHLGHRTPAERDEDRLSLPLRAVGEQALLRRQPQARGLHGARAHGRLTATAPPRHAAGAAR